MTKSRHICHLHTRIPSVAKGQPRTVEGARAALVAYEAANPDIPAPTRRMMGLSALGKYFGRRILEEAVGHKLPQLPFRDASWRWWNALNLAGLGSRWEDFVQGAYSGGTCEGAKRVRDYCEARGEISLYLTFLRHSGTNPWKHCRPITGHIWTRGGCWRPESSLTKLLVLKQHLPQRKMPRTWQRKMGHEKVRLLERELMNLIDPETLMSSDAKYRALDYTRRRLAEMLGYRRKRVGLNMAAWFFQQKLPYTRGAVVPDRATGYVTRNWDRKLRDHWST